MSRVINFSPGPATLPLPVLEEVERDLLDYQSTGISMLEHSHRGEAFSEVHAQATRLLKSLLGCQDTHDVLFMTGGASTQFALMPMNFLRSGTASYVDTGTWSQKAFKAASYYGRPKWGASGREESGAVVRAPMEIDEMEGDRYVHITSNATVAGVQYHQLPSTRAALVVDMSSDILHKPMDISGVDLIYAGAQKNLGPSGVTVVIVRKTWLSEAEPNLPDLFRYGYFSEKNSLGNTPPTFSIYVLSRFLAWVEREGGTAAMGRRNKEKADMLYGVLADFPEVYHCPVEQGSRSVMNAVFQLPSEELTAKFVQDAAAAGLVNLKGHRSVGGIRISMYNAMPPEDIAKLAEFMRGFASGR